MTETTFLAGAVRKITLPTVAMPAPADAPLLKRLLLPQGELAQVYDQAEGIHYLACLELRPGTVRGNHYHQVKREWLYVVQGEIEVTVLDLAAGEKAQFRLGSGDLGFIGAGIVHAFRTVRTGQGIEFSPSRFDPADIHRHTLIS